MEESNQFLTKLKEVIRAIPQKNKPEEQIYINPKFSDVKIRKTKQNKTFINLLPTLIMILVIIILLVFYFNKDSKSVNETKTPLSNINFESFYIQNNYSSIYQNKTIDDPDFTKFQKMLPYLTPDLNSYSSSMGEIFNSRQIYISDVKITPEYLRFVRPINETEEQKYNKRYSENETIINNSLFDKRSDQLNYINFCSLALKEQLIDYKKINYEKQPFISIIVPSYNKQDILLQSIRSIQNQNFQNIEIIIVNDCSTDNSSKVFN